MSSKSLPNGIRRGGAARIDLEPIYAQLKSAIGDKMGLYRDSVGAYMMGMSLLVAMGPDLGMWGRRSINC